MVDWLFESSGTVKDTYPIPHSSLQLDRSLHRLPSCSLAVWDPDVIKIRARSIALSGGVGAEKQSTTGAWGAPSAKE